MQLPQPLPVESLPQEELVLPPRWPPPLLQPAACATAPVPAAPAVQGPSERLAAWAAAPSLAPDMEQRRVPSSPPESARHVGRSETDSPPDGGREAGSGSEAAPWGADWLWRSELSGTQSSKAQQIPLVQELEMLRMELARERAAREQLQAHLQALGQISREPPPFWEAQALTSWQEKQLPRSPGRFPTSCSVSTLDGSTPKAARAPMPRVLLQPPRRVA